jgi:hypothetical protein
MTTYHLKISLQAPSPTQQAWLDRTSALAEGFLAQVAGIDAIDLALGSMAVHSAADFLFERLGEEAAFDKLDPGAFMATVVRSSPAHVSYFAEVLRDFYAFLIGTGEIEKTRGQYLACYFETLVELHGRGAAAILPTRASRRATATLARRITEARLRSEERAASKKTAA